MPLPEQRRGRAKSGAGEKKTRVRESWHYLKPKRRAGSPMRGQERSLRNPPGVVPQHKTFFTLCQREHAAGYGTKDVPNPPYIGYETA